MGADQHPPLDFAQALGGGDLPLIVGGQAVNVWAELYVADEPSLEKFAPFTSRDADIYGTQEMARSLAHRMGWECHFPDEADSVIVAVLSKDSGSALPPLTIEVLAEVNGLTAADLTISDVVELAPGTRCRIPTPTVLLKAKLYNLASLANLDRPQDLRHAEMLLRIVPQHLNELAVEHRAGNVSEVALAQAVRYATSVCSAPWAQSIATTHHLNLAAILPESLQIEAARGTGAVHEAAAEFCQQVPSLPPQYSSEYFQEQERLEALQFNANSPSVSNPQNDHAHAETPTAAISGSHPGTVGREGQGDRPTLGPGDRELAAVHEGRGGQGTGDDRANVRRERGEEAERLSRALLLSPDRAERLFRSVREHVEIDVFGFNDRRGFRSLPPSVQSDLAMAAARYGNPRQFFDALQSAFAHAQEDPVLFARSVQITPPETGKTIPDGATAIVFTEGSHRCAQIDFLPPGPPEPGSFPPERLMVDGYAMPAGLETLPAGRYVIEDGRAEPEQTIENPQLMPKDHVGEYARCSDDTRGLREEKERLYAQGFPILESQATVAKYYSAEKFDHLRSVSKPVYFCAPSTTGENILPYILAQNLRRDFGGVIMPDWATPQALTRTAEKTGIEKLREPPTYKLNKDALALVGKDATIVLVDDVVTTGGSVQGMREALAQEGLRASHVTSLAQSELRLVTEKDIDRMTAKLLGNEGRDAFARSRGFADFSAFAATEPHHADPERSGFTAWLREQPLRADVALALDGRLKHLANYIENSIRKTDANRNAEISEHLRAEAQRLRELGRTDAGAVLGIDERMRRLEGAQLAPRSVTGVDAGVSREGGAIRPGGPDPEGRDAAAAGNPPTVTETAKSLQASETLDRLTALRLEYADNPDKHVLTEARGIAEAVTGPAVTRVPFAVSAVEYVKGHISRADLELVAAKNDRAAAHDKNPKPDRSQDNDLGR